MGKKQSNRVGRVISTKLTQEFDYLTGEMTRNSESVMKSYAVHKENFATIYEAAADVVSELGKLEYRVFWRLLFTVQLENGILLLTTATRSKLARQMEITPRAIRYALAGLVKSGLLLRETAQDYALNPKYFWRGSQKGRADNLALILTLEEEAKKLEWGSHFDEDAPETQVKPEHDNGEAA